MWWCDKLFTCTDNVITGANVSGELIVFAVIFVILALVLSITEPRAQYEKKTSPALLLLFAAAGAGVATGILMLIVVAMNSFTAEFVLLSSAILAGTIATIVGQWINNKRK